MIWIILFTCLASCGWWCGRRYRQQRYQEASDFFIVQQPSNQAFSQPVNQYGAVEVPPYSAHAPPYSAAVQVGCIIKITLMCITYIYLCRVCIDILQN